MRIQAINKPIPRSFRIIPWFIHQGEFYHKSCYHKIMPIGSRSDYRTVYYAENEKCCVICDPEIKISRRRSR